ncbi:hydroxypyruvate isomerase family protein [Palleronia caenipelagi]|uniref:TIM barrel protein n=1 Tax=Palleronia caenipelagi TaxID=2489174 RepID=A0A547PM43_9RHOB|nr:TIM barrel protein [Palleronia caenipelagi]TRD15210.1 TIM barrel protein [Palleronia caenipelagi]
MKFSANLGLLWTDRPLPDAVRAAQRAGFDAVECHWPYETPAATLREALEETGLPMLSINTRRGDVSAGENGLTALPGRECDARAAIDEAIAYAHEIGAAHIHVMAGTAEGSEAHLSFVNNLCYACDAAATYALTILIEPLNRHDAPGYFLGTTTQADAIIREIKANNLRLMFDCYHVQRTEGDITTRLRALLPVIGHIQFASAPDRGTPDQGELNFKHVFRVIRELGWQSPLGAEYKCDRPTDETLGWLAAIRSQID